MTPRDSDSLFVIRVEQHAAIVAEIAPDARRVRRALRFPGGLRAIDDLIEALVVAATTKRLDAEPGTDAGFRPIDRNQLRREVAAARIRLVGDESTTVVVRRGGRTVFVPLERSSVVAVLARGTAAVARGLTTLGATSDSRIVELEGADEVPGLLDALPARVTRPVGSESYDLGSVLDSASWGPDHEPPVPRRATLVRRAWPGAVAVLLLLAVGGTAAAVNLSARPAEGHPATTTLRPDGSLGNTADLSATPTPAASVIPSSAPIVATDVARPSAPHAPARSTPTSAASNPGTGPAPGSSTSTGPVAPSTPPHTDSPAPDPTPSGPPTTDPGSPG